MSNMYCKKCRRTFDMSGAILCRCPQCGDRYMTAAEGMIPLDRVYSVGDADDLCVSCEHYRFVEHRDRDERPTPECRAFRWDFEDIESVTIQTPFGSEELFYCERYEREV